MEVSSDGKSKLVTSAEKVHTPALLPKKRSRRASKQETGQSKYQFVNATEEHRRHANDRSVVRSQAMKSFLRTEKKSLPARNEMMAGLLAPDVSSRTTQHRFRLGPWGIQQLSVKPRKPKTRRIISGQAAEPQSLFPGNAPDLELLGHTQVAVSSPTRTTLHPKTFDGGNIDPFDSLPIPASKRTQFLLKYSHTQITSSPLMTYPKRKWFWLACKDPAYFHAALSHYSGHLSLVQRRGDPDEALMHRMAAVNIINERLNTSDLATSDGTIGAISCMINYEANNGTLESVRAHMMGLQEVVKLRGGVQNAGFSTSLHRLVAWADINSANALSTQPLFPSIENRPPEVDSPSIAVVTMCVNRSIPYSSAPSDLQAVLADLQCLSSAFPRGDQRRSWDTSSMWYADILYHCKRSLILLSHSNPSSLVDTIVIACSYAAAILVEVCFRGVSVNARIVDTLSGSLKSILDRLFADPDLTLDDNSGQAKMVFWAAFIGGIVSVERSVGTWFAEQAAKLVALLEVHTWNDAESILKNALWRSDWEVPHEAFWRVVKRGVYL